MSPEEMRLKAIDLFNKRFHCSQAVLAVGLEKLNIANETLVKSMGAFGGGIASTGRVCGSLSGGIALISSLFSKGSVEEQDDPKMWRLSFKLAKKFEELTAAYGGVNCLDIAQMNWKDRDAVREFYSNPESRRKHCVHLVGETAFALGELLEKEGVAEP
jgi:C_GCAxxG_C_C family probable redox protein